MMHWTRALPRIDHNSDQGKACQNAVKIKLKDYLGQEYADDVLPLYIVVMLAHGNSAALVAENLEAFLGKNDAAAFTTWLIGHLDKHAAEYAAAVAGPDEAAGNEEAANKHGRHRESPKVEHAREERRERAREKIEWRGEDGRSRQRSAEREKRARDSPTRSERRHGSRHAKAEDGRDEKRRRQDLRELRPLNASQNDHRRRGHRDESPQHREDRNRDLYERDRQRHAAERHRMERDRELDRDFERRRELEYRERMLREREYERDRERDYLRDRLQDPRWERHSHFSREPLGLQMDRDDHEKAEMDWREERAQRLGEPQGLNGLHAKEPRQGRGDVQMDRSFPEPHSAQTDQDDAAKHRGTVFDRLAMDLRSREESARSLAAARKSVFDRLRGNRQATVTALVQPDALTDDELDDTPPARALAPIRTVPRRDAQATMAHSQPVSKAEELAEMQRKMLELQQQVKQLEREQRTPRAPPTPVVVHTSAAPLQTPPSVDPCSVHVQNLSHLAIPDIIGAHFSGCGRVMNVTIARDLQGKPRGFAHVEFSNELESQNALSLHGSMLLNQVITVMPKVKMPPAHFALPSYTTPARGRGRGRGSFGSPGHGAFRGGFPRPFAGRGPTAARGRGRQAPLVSNKYVRPELKAGMPADGKAAGPTTSPAPSKVQQATNGLAAPAHTADSSVAEPAAAVI